MNNTHAHARRERRVQRIRTASAVGALTALSLTGLAAPALAASPAENATVHESPAQPQTVDGIGLDDGPADLRFGTGNNILLDSVTLAEGVLRLAASDAVVQLRRVNNACTDVERQTLWIGNYTNDGSAYDFEPSFPGSMADALASRDLTTGMDNVFANAANLVTCNNIERLDFTHAAFTVADTAKDGYLLVERGGNDSVKVAAVLEVDAAGSPTRLGSLYGVSSGNWGPLGVNLASLVLQNEPGAQWKAHTAVSSQPVSAQFVTAADLGLAVGDEVLGFAMFGNDVNASHDLLGLSDVPTDTGDAAGGIDLIGAYLSSLRSREIGDTVWLDANADGIQNEDEQGVPDVTVQLFDDEGVLLATTTTDAAGKYSFEAGVGTYTVRIVVPQGYLLTSDRDSGTTAPDGVSSVPAGELSDLAIDFGIVRESPTIAFEKSASVDTYTSGDDITYTFIASNVGNVTLSTVTIAEDSFSGTGVLTDLECTVPQPAMLEPGDDLVCTADYVATDEDAELGSIVNVASATGTALGATEPLAPVEDAVTITAVPEQPGAGDGPEDPAPDASEEEVDPNGSLAITGQDLNPAWWLGGTALLVLGAGIMLRRRIIR